jgi:cytochrome c oxidase subunit 2
MKLTRGLAIGFVTIVVATLYLITENMSRTADTALAPIEVKVVAHEWWWEFDYPKLGVKIANELRIPEKRTVRLELISTDVLHSFWLPSMEKRVDVIPGKTSTLLITARSRGTLHGSCDASCGCNTVCMRFRVIVTNELEFGQWIDRQRGVSLAPPKNSAPSCALGRMSQEASSLTAAERLAAILSGKNGTREASRFSSP